MIDVYVDSKGNVREENILVFKLEFWGPIVKGNFIIQLILTFKELTNFDLYPNKLGLSWAKLRLS